jgi:hypothetical protein
VREDAPAKLISLLAFCILLSAVGTVSVLLFSVAVVPVFTDLIALLGFRVSPPWVFAAVATAVALAALVGERRKLLRHKARTGEARLAVLLAVFGGLAAGSLVTLTRQMYESARGGLGPAHSTIYAAASLYVTLLGATLVLFGISGLIRKYRRGPY